MNAPPSLPQNSDHLSLDEALEAMRRIGTPKEYIQGYEDGVLDRYSRSKAIAYRRGFGAGILARERGAHSEASTEIR